MVLLDTSVLVAGFGRSSRVTGRLRECLAEGEIVRIPALALYEWLRGLRTPEELEAQVGLFSPLSAIPFGASEAAVAAELHSSLRRARRREMDIAVAALRHRPRRRALDPQPRRLPRSPRPAPLRPAYPAVASDPPLTTQPSAS